MAAVSVIIPVYNAAKYLSQCLQSVCNQTLRDIEIICVNDASTDNSLEILQEFSKQDARIKIIDLKENKGAAVARNTAIKSAGGEYLGFVDSDDFIDLNFYEKLYKKAKETNACVVKGKIVIYCPKTKSVLNSDVKNHKENYYFNFTAAIYRTSLVRENAIEFLEGLIYFEDTYFTIKSALFYKKLEAISDVSYYYVNNPGSATHRDQALNLESLIDGTAKVLDILDEHCSDKQHYLVVFDFLLEHILWFCRRFDVSDEVNAKAPLKS